MKSPSLKRETKKDLFIYGMMFPASFLELFIHMIPLALGVLISVKLVNINTISDWINAPFAGLKNYESFLTPALRAFEQFWQSAWVTLQYGVSAKVLHFALGMWGALILNRKFRGRGLFRTIFMIPYAIPSFISAISWKFLFLKDWGLINHILVDKLHLMQTKPFWLVGENAVWAVVIAQVWRGWSFHFIMILAGLQTISKDLYEAVDIDGGNVLHKFRHVTLVGLRPILTTLLVVNGMKIFNEFETTFVMLSERPPDSANLMSVNIYNQAFNNWNFGIASANSIAWILMIFAVSFVLMKLLMPKEEETHV